MCTDPDCIPPYFVRRLLGPPRFLAVLGEGVSSQVILAADTFSPAAPHVAIKVLKRQYSYAGQKVPFCPRTPNFSWVPEPDFWIVAPRGMKRITIGAQLLWRFCVPGGGVRVGEIANVQNMARPSAAVAAQGSFLAVAGSAFSSHAAPGMRVHPDCNATPPQTPCHVSAQESRALRFLHSAGALPAPGIVQLRGSFSFEGHHCLVMERLGANLLDLIAESAQLERREAVAQLRSVAAQLLVGTCGDPRLWVLVLSPGGRRQVQGLRAWVKAQAVKGWLGWGR